MKSNFWLDKCEEDDMAYFRNTLFNKISIPNIAIPYPVISTKDKNGDYKWVTPNKRLKLMEDAMVIYQLVRAPDRKVTTYGK